MKNLVKWNALDFILLILVTAAFIGSRIQQVDLSPVIYLFFLGSLTFNLVNKYPMQKYLDGAYFHRFGANTPPFSKVIKWMLIVGGGVTIIFAILELLHII